MIKKILPIIFVFSSFFVSAQKLLLLDRFNGNKIVNDSTVTVYSTDPNIVDLTIYFTMKNNTDRPLALFLRKHINYIADSTIDYFCFGVSCWPETDTTNIADTIQPGAEDFTFASHVVHYRRFELPPLPAGKSSITYTIYDTTAADPVEATVTVIYHLSGVGVEERKADHVIIYPNPATDFIRIPLNEISESNYLINIYAASGLLIKQDVVNVHNGFAEYHCSGLPAGCYIGKLISDKSPVNFKFTVGK